MCCCFCLWPKRLDWPNRTERIDLLNPVLEFLRANLSREQFLRLKSPLKIIDGDEKSETLFSRFVVSAGIKTSSSWWAFVGEERRSRWAARHPFAWCWVGGARTQRWFIGKWKKNNKQMRDTRPRMKDVWILVLSVLVSMTDCRLSL